MQQYKKTPKVKSLKVLKSEKVRNLKIGWPKKIGLRLSVKIRTDALLLILKGRESQRYGVHTEKAFKPIDLSFTFTFT